MCDDKDGLEEEQVGAGDSLADGEVDESDALPGVQDGEDDDE
jgi:hypothetical protein